MINLRVYAISGDGDETAVYEAVSIENGYFKIIKNGDVREPLATQMYDAKSMVKIIFDDIPKRVDKEIDQKKYLEKIQEIARLWKQGIYSTFFTYSYLTDTPEYLKEFKERLIDSIPKHEYPQEIYFDEFLIPINFSGAFSYEGGFSKVKS
ncbi:hypothetical protein [Ohtaekwangia koreensis]|uniref:Uncharacterized protein n=1 Tax=Ohtaekwangia koreensis TaxID=688867 RepID=A0A1T5JQN5_9BACT|nr:hypothetical protein [Ohtaekwangia koreensis]SKC53643.1 hypothetical protein SAMN05660236_1369 [Ohtaekwangia koreensis]